MDATNGADLLLELPSVQILRVCGGQVERVTTGALQVLQHASMLFLVCQNAFSYPLVNQPVLKSEERVFILPAEGGTHYVVYVAGEVPASTVAAFEEVLQSTTQMRAQMVANAQAQAAPAAQAQAIVPVASPALAVSAAPSSSAVASPAAARPPAARGIAGEVGSALSSALLLTGKLASKAVVYSAELAGKGVAATARGMKSYFNPAKPGTHVRPETIARLEQAKVVSRMAVTVSAGLVTAASTMAKSLATALSDAVMSTEVGDAIRKGGESNSGQAVKQVAHSGLAAFSEVWDSLEKAATVFGQKAGPGVLDFAQHRYGDEGAAVARQSLDVSANVVGAALNMRNLTVGGLVRRTAGETARELILRDHTLSGEMEITPAGFGALPAGRPALLDSPAAVPLATPLGGAGTDPMAIPLGTAPRKE